MLAQLKADYPDDLRVVYRHFPLIQIHDKAALATQASEAAGEQGKFWQMHDVLFQRQSEWAAMTEAEFTNWLLDVAAEIGLDVAQFQSDLTSVENREMAQRAFEKGVEKGIPGTPFLLVNGEIYNGPRDYNNLSLLVRLLALQEIQYDSCPPVVIDPAREYRATIQTEKGDIVVRLFVEESPIAVNNFVFLAREGWYDGVTFHRVLESFMAQAGDPSGTGFGGPGYAFVNESSPDLKFDQAGMVAMANAGPDSNGSQFFITFGPQPHLDGGFTIFGEVIEGMDVFESISLRNPQENANLPPGDEIITITIQEK